MPFFGLSSRPPRGGQAACAPTRNDIHLFLCNNLVVRAVWSGEKVEASYRSRFSRMMPTISSAERPRSAPRTAGISWYSLALGRVRKVGRYWPVFESILLIRARVFFDSAAPSSPIAFQNASSAAA